MSGAIDSMPRATGHALMVAHPSTRAPGMAALQSLGFTCDAVDDPYAATLALCRGGGIYRAVVLGLAGLFKEELAFIELVKHRFTGVEVWLTQTDGRQAALAEAMRHGADALLGEDGLFRLAAGNPGLRLPTVPLPLSASSSSASTANSANAETASSLPAWTSLPADDRRSTVADLNDSADSSDPADDPLTRELTIDEPVLTADELRALLHENPHGLSGGVE